MITYNASGYTYDHQGITYDGGMITTSERLCGMNWAPRWMKAYYDTSDNLKKLYFLGLVYPQNEMTNIIQDELYPRFWGKTGHSRYLFVARYDWPKEYIPSIDFVGPDGTVSLDPKDTIGSLLYEKVSQSYSVHNGKLLFKNLALVSINVTAASGLLDISSTLSSDPALEDSPFIVENSYGDIEVIDQTSWAYDNGTIKTGLTGLFTVYYLSQDVHDKVLSGFYYVLIDGQLTYLDYSENHNMWDSYAYTLDLERHHRESNLSLGNKCRILSLANKFEQRLGAALGLSEFFHWGAETTSSFSFTGSGAYGIELIDSKEFEYIKERPYKEGDNFLLTHVPHDYVQLFYKDRKVESSAYTVSGGIIVSISNVLKNATQENVVAQYRTTHFTRTASGDFVEAVDVNNDGAPSVLGVYSRNLRVINSSKRIDNWRWNTDPGLLSGTADFDF